MKSFVYQVSINTFVAVPAGQPAPCQFLHPILFKEIELIVGKPLIGLDVELALAEIAKQGWHHWKVKMEMDVRP